MEKKTIRIYKEDDVEIELTQIIKQLNETSEYLTFVKGKSKLSIETETLTHRKSLEDLESIQSNESTDNLLTLFITNKPYDDNYFFHGIKNHRKERIFLLSLAHWDSYTTYSKNTGVFYFIVDILALGLDETNDRHDKDKTTKCIYNFMQKKSEIEDGIKSATICDSCQERIMDEEDETKSKILNDIILLLEELKKSNSYNDIVEYWSLSSNEQVKLFFSYAHEDREYLNEFKDYVKIFERNGLVEQWDDNELVVGEKWDSKIKDKIYSADIVIFLLSASSLASDYIYNHELKVAFELNEMDEVYVIPIIIKDCLWDMTEFSEFQILPLDGKAVNSWRLKEEAWTSVARGLKKAIDNIIVAKQENIKSAEDIEVEDKIFFDTNKILFDDKQDLTETSKYKIVLKFLKTYSRWWFNIPRIINWGSERNGFSELKKFTNDELKKILQELEKENKVQSKKSSKSNNLLYRAV